MRRPLADGRGGVALLVTLMMVSVLTMMVVGLAGVMRNEQAAARNLTYQVLAEQVAEIGVAEAMAAVLSNSPTGPNPGFTATGPGWAFQNQPPAAFLFSTNTNAGVKNLEMFGTNSMILSLPATAPRVDGFVAGGWVPLFRPNETNAFARYAWWVDDEASKLNLNLTGSNDPSLAALSTRTPFATNWVFVNPATGQAFTPFTNRLAFRTNVFWSTESVKDLGVYGGANTNMPLTAAQYRQIKGNITAWSAVRDDLTPWGSAKLNLSDPLVTTNQIKLALATNSWTNLFGSGGFLARKYSRGSASGGLLNNFGDVVLDQIVADLQGLRRGPVAVSTNSSSGSGNLNNFRHRFQLPNRPVANIYPDAQNPVGLFPYVTEVMASVDSIALGQSIAVTLYLQIEVFNPWPYATPANAFRIRALPRKFRFHVTSGNGTATPIVVGPTGFPSVAGTVWPDNNGPMQGISGTLGCWGGPMMEDNNPWPDNAPIIRVLPNMTPQSTQIIPISLTWTMTYATPGVTPIRVDQAYVMLDRVVLETFGGVPLDWISLDDFSQVGNYGSSYTRFPSDNGQMAFNRATATYPVARRGPAYRAVSPSQSAGAFLPPNAQGLGKSDPRVRISASVWAANDRGVFRDPTFPTSWRAWYPVGLGVADADPITPNAPNDQLFLRLYNNNNPNENSLSFLSLSPDPRGGANAITNHPHFAAGFVPTNGLSSIAQIGAAHTGIPWRTLRLQPTPAAELAFGPPDWIVLDVFTLSGNSAPRPMFNVNSAMLGMVRSGNQWTQGLVTNSLGQIQARPWAFLGAMGPVGTNLSTSTTIINRAISNGIPVSMTNGAITTAVLTNLAGNLTNALLAPTNPAVWSANSGWGGYRAANTNRFPSRGLLLRGEILEVRGLAEDTNATPTTGEDLLEGRQRLFLDMMTTRSDTFSVWSVGQGLSVFTNARGRIQTNVMGEVRQQTVFQRVPVQQNGVTTEYRVERLYSRTHTLEELAAEDLR